MPSTTRSSGEITVTMRMDSSPGRIVMEAEIEREPRTQDVTSDPVGYFSSATQSITGDPIDDLKVKFLPSSIARIRGAYSNSTVEVARALGVGPSFVSSAGAVNNSGQIIDRLQSINSEVVDTTPGETDVVRREINFTPIKIPDYDTLDYTTPEEIYENMAVKPSMTIKVRANDPLQNFVAGAMTADFDIPAGAVIERVEPNITECSNIYPDIFSRARSYTNSIDIQLQEVRDSISRVDRLYNELENSIGRSPSEGTPPDIARIDASTADSLRRRAESLSIRDTITLPGAGQVTIQGAVRELESLESRSEEVIALPRCQNEFDNQIQTHASDLRSLSEEVDRAQSRKPEIDRLLVGTEGTISGIRSRMSLPEGGDDGGRSIGDVFDPSNYRGVRGIIEDVQDETGDVVDDITDGDTRDQVEDVVDGGSEDEFERFREPEPGSRDRQRRVEETVEDCTSQYPTMTNRIENYENVVMDLGTESTRFQFHQAVMEGEQLIRDIRNNVDREECRTEFAQRVRDSIQLLEDKSEVASLVIYEERTDEFLRERNQINELRSRANEILGM